MQGPQGGLESRCAVCPRGVGDPAPPASGLPFGKAGLASPDLQTFSKEDRNPD